jgi:hypothetical protein
MSRSLESALQYEARGFSVIPVRPDKKPYIKWEPFQRRRAASNEIRKWWEDWSRAMIGIVTGSISGICAVDVDTQEGFEAIQEYIPDSLVMPTYVTPSGGQHMIFQCPSPPLGNNSRIIPGCDFRGQGGYVIWPPSNNGQKQYRWLPALSVSEVDPPPLPGEYIERITKAIEGGCKGGIGESTYTPPLDLREGNRDNALFHIANCLIKGGMLKGEALQVLEILSKSCNPPFSLKEARVKIESALKRVERRNRSLSEEIREWILSSNGQFFSRDIQNCLGLSSRKDQKLVWWVLNDMIEKGFVERSGNRHGCYRRIEGECEEIDFVHASTETVDLWLPFDIQELVEVMPGNIIVIAGEVNAGKTAFLLNVVQGNMDKFDVHYFSSEMGASELRKRLFKFDCPLDRWRFKAKERSDNFADVIAPGEGRLNIIDFLEIHENFFEIGGRLAEIHKKLKGAVGIVAIQKNPGVDVGLGGFRGLEKPRLYLAMSQGRLKIVKAKIWATSENPNGKEVNFKLVEGSKFKKTDDWHLPD